MTKLAGPCAVHAFTFGCKVNVCDTNALMKALEAGGFSRAEDDGRADVIVINTCAVTDRAIAKARGHVRRIRARNAAALVIITGCAVKFKRESFEAMPEVDRCFASVEEAGRFLGSEYGFRPALAAAPSDPRRTRAFVKVQDGCDSFCSYCIVPLLRGEPRSVSPERVLDMLRAAGEAGYREVVLTGIHLGLYGRDLGTVTLGRLLRSVAEETSGFRVRLSSLEPLEATPELLRAMASSPRFCSHLHLPLQSGSDRILSAMGRPYSRKGFLESVARAREVLNNPAVTTDIMVGFPGETEADHNMTVETIGAAGIARAHVFVFNPRPGTAAADMPGRVAPFEARRRSGEARAAAARSARAYREGLRGRRLEVLGETFENGFVEGFSSEYQRVRFKGGSEHLGNLVRVSVAGAVAGCDTVLEGTALEAAPVRGD